MELLVAALGKVKELAGNGRQRDWGAQPAWGRARGFHAGDGGRMGFLTPGASLLPARPQPRMENLAMVVRPRAQEAQRPILDAELLKA